MQIICCCTFKIETSSGAQYDMHISAYNFFKYGDWNVCLFVCVFYMCRVNSFILHDLHSANIYIPY
jgi:hypothetical protein